MKLLCICQYGHSRSVCLSRVLQKLGHAAVAIGHATCGDAIIPLSQWADRICIVDGGALARVPVTHRGKILNFDVGPDRWVNPYNAELTAIFEKLVQERLSHG